MTPSHLSGFLWGVQCLLLYFLPLFPWFLPTPFLCSFQNKDINSSKQGKKHLFLLPCGLSTQRPQSAFGYSLTRCFSLQANIWKKQKWHHVDLVSAARWIASGWLASLKVSNASSSSWGFLKETPCLSDAEGKFRWSRYRVSHTGTGSVWYEIASEKMSAEFNFLTFSAVQLSASVQNAGAVYRVHHLLWGASP